MDILIGLAGVSIGAVITLFTGAQSRRWAHTQWVLGERSRLYGDVHKAYSSYMLDPSEENAFQLLAELNDASLISSARVDIAARLITPDLLLRGRDAAGPKLAELVSAMSADLLYPPRSGLVPGEARRRLTRARRERAIRKAQRNP